LDHTRVTQTMSCAQYIDMVQISNELEFHDLDKLIYNICANDK